MGMYYDYNIENNKALKRDRGISFDEIIAAIEGGKLLDIIKHPNKKYGQQKIYIVDIDNYAYLVPFVKTGNNIFLKTIFPSRKLTKVYFDKNDTGQENE